MIEIESFIKELRKNDLNFCSGVPDSLFKDLCYGFERKYKKNHIIAANEGSAIAIGVGYYLSSNKIPIVYMQNSGLGNAINPLISLADKNVYNIPLFLIIGWRGEKHKTFVDEPQHITQGIVTPKFLKNLDIRYKIIDANSNFKFEIKKLKEYAKKKKQTVAFLIKKNSFKKIKTEKKKKIKNTEHKIKNLFLREKILESLVNKLPKKSIIVSTTGILSRELNEIIKRNKYRINNFMCVGGMGHAVSIASGMASKLKKKIFCFDGDGAITMHLGSLATSSKFNNLVHIVFNNYSHESVGGHDNAAKHVKFHRIAKELGYKNYLFCWNDLQAVKALKKSLKSKGSFFIEIILKKGHRKNISRPTEKMHFLKDKFMRGL